MDPLLVPPPIMPLSTTPLADNDEEPFEAFCLSLTDATHGLILLCDHAESRLPAHYGTLGLEARQLERHIGYDIGALALSQALAARLNACLVASRFSRLLIDPNRGQDDPTLIMRLSDGAVVPGNAAISAAERARRIARYYVPYDTAIARAIGHVSALRIGAPVLISLHSFTPIWRGHPRPWHAGVLWDKDSRVAAPMLHALRAVDGLVVGDNEPYRGELPGDTMHRHGTVKGLPHCLLEVRQDLICDAAGVACWVDILAPILERILEDKALRV